MAQKATLLQSAVPLERGPVKHIERNDDAAFTTFDREGKVKAINTPQEAFRRVHEVMHARHTVPKDYAGVRQEIFDIIEDCRLHSLFWPWRGRREDTPPEVIEGGRILVEGDLKAARSRKRDPRPTDFDKFAAALRGRAVLGPMGLDADIPYPTRAQTHLGRNIESLIWNGQHRTAALMLEEVFFSEDEEEDFGEEETKSPPKSGFEDIAADMMKPPSVRAKKKAELDKALERAYRGMSAKMQIIELPRVEPTTTIENSPGYRLATSGSRLNRPALRRPVLPQRIFWKHAPTLPGGAILFDASGSMGVTEEVLLDCCRRAPTATVAYYHGTDGDGRGWLKIFAKDGLRAREINPAHPAGNTVDGPAMDWLMEQTGPRLFVTDREFTGAGDSYVQIARLEQLEKAEDITVYESYSAFKKAFPRQETI